MRNFLISIVVTLCSIVIVMGITNQIAGQDSSSAITECNLNGKTLIVAHDVNFPPFEYLQDDKYTGFDLDLLNELMQVCNFKADRRAMDFNGIIPALQAKQVNLAVTAMTIRPKRAEVVDFSIPYFRSGLVLVVKSNNNGIIKPEDLKGKTIAVRIGTSGETFIRGLPYADQIKIVTFDSVNDTYLAVINGIADAMINDDSTVRYYIETSGTDTLKIVGDLLTGDDYGIAIPKDQTDLLTAINNGLKELVKKGIYNKLYQKWFGVIPVYRPGEF